MNWIISNKPISMDKRFSSFTLNGITVYFENEDFFHNYEDGIKIAIDGYVIPRFEIFESYKNLNQYELVHTLFKKQGRNFIQYLKGVFTIILITNQFVQVYNDRHGLKKFFVYKKNSDYLVSSNLEIISQKGQVTVSKKNAAIFSLMEHFIDGITLFTEVEYSKPATRFSINKKLEVDHYWYAEDLLNLEIKKISFDDFAFIWKTIIKQYIDYLKPRDITLTLTGGNDTRMILAALLKLSIKFNTFTFGNPMSGDGITARKIANLLNLNHHNYFFSNPSVQWFKSLADRIIPLGNSLINIHRAHRLDALDQEMFNNPANEMILGGFMGGDYIKGIIYDDYITAQLVRLWEFDKRDKRILIKKELKKKYFNYEETDIEELLLFLENQNFFSAKNKISRQFQYTFNVVGAVHHIQDINIFASKMKYTVNPFMDCDFLKMLFSSKHSMLFKKNDSKIQLKKMMYPILPCKIIDFLYNKLNNIEFIKKGYYTPAEFLGNKIIYILKRISRYRKSNKFPASFPYEEWMKNFTLEEMKDLDLWIKNTFKTDEIKERLGKDFHDTTEGYWHQFTNVINLNKILIFYKKNGK